MPSKSSNNGYAFGPNNTNAAISNTNSSKNPFISNNHSNQSGALPIPSSSNAAAYQQQGGRPSPSRSLTGGGHSPLLANYDRGDHQQDGSGNRLLGAGMSRQGSADSMGSAVSSSIIFARVGSSLNVVADDDDDFRARLSDTTQTLPTSLPRLSRCTDQHPLLPHPPTPTP